MQETGGVTPGFPVGFNTASAASREMNGEGSKGRGQVESPHGTEGGAAPSRGEEGAAPLRSQRARPEKCRTLRSTGQGTQPVGWHFTSDSYL